MTIRGLVQGVGFRPFIYRIANEMKIKGEVGNRNNGVSIRAILTQEQRLKEVREENKKLKEEQKQLYEINGYLTNERNALVEYRNDIENSKTRRMLQKIDKVRGK